MLILPEQGSAETFLARNWQKKALFMPQALPERHPRITRNELAWLATLDDVESRIVFVERNGDVCRYRTENGPFDHNFLGQLPARDWTLLVHDVEKHLPAMRAYFDAVPFIPDWRIDDLMVSFAAPGGGVGPHRDNYDVFLCQGTGVRQWHYSAANIAENSAASDDLALLHEFDGEMLDARAGDVLYLPPGVAHWGIAKRACMTYSIGMRAPRNSEIAFFLGASTTDRDNFYQDPNLEISEAAAGLISKQAVNRTLRLLGLEPNRRTEAASALGRFATQTKDWLRPDGTADAETDQQLRRFTAGACLTVHGMAQIAYDEHSLYLNGFKTALPQAARPMVMLLCEKRSIRNDSGSDVDCPQLMRWMLEKGAFEIPEDCSPYVK